MKIKKIGRRWFVININGITASQWVPFRDEFTEQLNTKYLDGEHDVSLIVRILNHGPKCTALWPNREHYECNGTGMMAEL